MHFSLKRLIGIIRSGVAAGNEENIKYPDGNTRMDCRDFLRARFNLTFPTNPIIEILPVSKILSFIDFSLSPPPFFSERGRGTQKIFLG